MSKMSYSESEPGFSNLLSTLAPIFSGSKSESDDSESHFNSVLISLDICIFLSYIYTLLNKLVDGFFIYSKKRINSYASNASIMHIFFWHIITQKVCFYHTIKFSYFSF